MRPMPFLALPVLLLLASPTWAQEEAHSLPERAPIPLEAPDVNRTEADNEPTDADRQPLPDGEAAPLPASRPATNREELEPATADTGSPVLETAASMPPEERACRSRLRELGVDFEDHPPQSEPEGCEIAHPLTVSSLGGDVALEPEGVMNCATAEANARFVRDHAQREAQHHLSSRIASVNQVSAYVCRPRAGTRTLSEHAYGNALDWGAILFEDGERLDVRLYRRGSPEALFLAALRRHACGPFKTVLGPGSDADHADHLHFDLAERRGGSTYCR